MWFRDVVMWLSWLEAAYCSSVFQRSAEQVNNYRKVYLPMGDLEKYDQMLVEIRRDFLSQLEVISDKMKALCEEPSLCVTSSQAFSEMKTIAHNLHGSAGTFGFRLISEAATPLDHLLTDLEQDYRGVAVDEQNFKRLKSMITDLIVSVDESLVEADG